MTPSEKFTQVRKYHFASLVAEADIKACKAGIKFNLPLAKARVMFVDATITTKRGMLKQHLVLGTPQTQVDVIVGDLEELHDKKRLLVKKCG